MSRRLTMLTPCAYIHGRLRNAFYRRKTGFLLLGLGLVVSASILLWSTGPRARVAGTLHTAPSGQWLTLKAPPPIAAAAESGPPPTPTFPPLLSPTSLPIPDTGLVWGRNAIGAYLWKSPEGKILTRLPNGSKVKILDERSSYGNLPWVKVHSPSGDGWILLTQVFRQNRSPAAYIAIGAGTFLRDQPRGGVQQALSLGTPIMNILGMQETEGRSWVQVEVLDGAVGWVAEEWLSTDLPTRDGDD